MFGVDFNQLLYCFLSEIVFHISFQEGLPFLIYFRDTDKKEDDKIFIDQVNSFLSS